MKCPIDYKVNGRDSGVDGDNTVTMDIVRIMVMAPMIGFVAIGHV